MNDVDRIRLRLISCYEFSANVPSLMDAVCHNAKKSQYHYDWASTQKRVHSVTETRSRKAKELDVFAATNNLIHYKQALNNVSNQEQKAWLKLAYAGTKPDALASFLNLWLLTQYACEDKGLQDRTVRKLKRLIAYALADCVHQVRGKKYGVKHAELAETIGVSQKTWENVWSSKYRRLRQIVRSLDCVALTTCESEYIKLFSKSA